MHEWLKCRVLANSSNARIRVLYLIRCSYVPSPLSPTQAMPPAAPRRYICSPSAVTAILQLLASSSYRPWPTTSSCMWGRLNKKSPHTTTPRSSLVHCSLFLVPCPVSLEPAPSCHGCRRRRPPGSLLSSSSGPRPCVSSQADPSRVSVLISPPGLASVRKKARKRPAAAAFTHPHPRLTHGVPPPTIRSRCPSTLPHPPSPHAARSYTSPASLLRRRQTSDIGRWVCSYVSTTDRTCGACGRTPGADTSGRNRRTPSVTRVPGSSRHCWKR